MTKMNELISKMKKAEEEKSCNKMKTVLAIIGVIVVVAAIAFAVYKFITRCKKDEEICECEDFFEEEDSCIELEFVSPEAENKASAEDITVAEAHIEEE